MAGAAEGQRPNRVMQVRPKRLEFRRLLVGHFHWKCLLCSLLVAVCASHVGYCQFYGPIRGQQQHSLSQSPGPCSHGYNLIPMALGALLYMVYLSECWHYRSQLCSLPRMGGHQASQLAEAMLRAVPVVWWKSVSYHYLRRARQVTRYRNGDAVTRMQVYYERVNSHQSGNVFLYDQCGYKDISKQLVDLDRHPIVRIRFSKGFVFACLQAANEFEEQRSRFFDESNLLDDYMEVREGLDLASLPFVERALVFPQRKVTSANSCCWPLFNHSQSQQPSFNSNSLNASALRMPWWLSSWAFWPASLLLQSWPLRMVVECRTGHAHLQVTKLFGTNYLSPSSVNYTGLLTRTSTMDSQELELANRQNYLMVPSYSEAILLDPCHQQQPNSPAGIFRQLFGSPHRSLPRPPVSHCAPPPLDYGSFGAAANGKGQKECAIGPPRSRSIGGFESNSNGPPNRGGARHSKQQNGRNEGRRHLPRPSQLVVDHRRLHQRQMPARSATISEGISLIQQVDDEWVPGCSDSDRMPLLAASSSHRPGVNVAPPLAVLAEEEPPDEPPPPYEELLSAIVRPFISDYASPSTRFLPCSASGDPVIPASTGCSFEWLISIQTCSYK